MPFDGHPSGKILNGWFAWLRSVPERLVQRLAWQNHGDVSDFPPGAIVLLYAGKDDASSLDAVLHSVDPKLIRRVRAFDIRRDGRASSS